jgi:Sec-independent protein secretion pathway component TatC
MYLGLNGCCIFTFTALVTDQPPICDKVCGVAIGVGITMFFLITFSLFMLWFTKKKNDRRKTNMKVCNNNF